MGQGDDAAFGIIIIVALILIAIWAVIIFIIENLVLFFCLGLIIWAIYYYAQNAPKWEKERVKRTSFTFNNTKNHTNFKVLYVTAEKNIEALKSSFLMSTRDSIVIKGLTLEVQYDGTERIAKFSKDLKSVYHYTNPPNKLYKEGMGVTQNPYVSATQTVDSLINETIRIPNILISLEKRCKSLREKGIDSDRFDNILNSVSSNFTIDNHRRLSLLVKAETRGNLEKSVGSSPASAIKV
tara:strand:- start:9 stop:725 length:717 start_codon:yes stop_codon:yes gene_type:complete